MTKTFAAAIAILALSSALSQAAVRTYFAPEVDGKRLDTCLAGDQNCGKPAADAFCKVEGYEKALLFQREAAANTFQIGNRASCAGPSCTSFKQIKCYTPKDDFAGLQLPAE
jgi:hypothetical protein